MAQNDPGKSPHSNLPAGLHSHRKYVLCGRLCTRDGSPMVVMREHFPDERPAHAQFVGGDLSGRFFKCGIFLADIGRGDAVRLI